MLCFQLQPAPLHHGCTVVNNTAIQFGGAVQVDPWLTPGFCSRPCACFQCLKLKYDILLSNFACFGFNCNLRPCSLVAACSSRTTQKPTSPTASSRAWPDEQSPRHQTRFKPSFLELMVESWDVHGGVMGDRDFFGLRFLSYWGSHGWDIHGGFMT